jgi:hypothetical protein
MALDHFGFVIYDSMVADPLLEPCCRELSNHTKTFFSKPTLWFKVKILHKDSKFWDSKF